MQIGPARPEAIARRFRNARAATVEGLLETLAAVSSARRLDDGRFAP